ncbi:MAG: helix-turn-helix transcriptional regulator [Phycisphaerae bacterium]
MLAEARRASAKLESMLPPAILESVGSVLDKLSVSLPPVADHDGTEDIFDRLSHAAADRLICRIRYNSFHDGEIINLTVHPLHLAFKSRAWYLRAFSCEHKQRRTFKLSRIEQVTVTEETFLPPADGSDGGFGLAWSMIPEGQVFDVLLRFSPKVAGNVAEVQWHPTQQIEHNEGGSIDFRVRVDGIGEISWWVLGYGSEVEVLAPQQLRDRVASTARKMLEIYEGANPCER